MNPDKPGCLFPFLGDGIDLELYCKPLFSSYWHMCHCVMSRLKTLCISLVWVIFQWANLAGLIFSSFFSSWLLWSEEHQCQHRPWAQLCLIWHEAVPAASSQLRADLVTAGEDGEGKE